MYGITVLLLRLLCRWVRRALPRTPVVYINVLIYIVSAFCPLPIGLLLLPPSFLHLWQGPPARVFPFHQRCSAPIVSVVSLFLIRWGFFFFVLTPHTQLCSGETPSCVARITPTPSTHTSAAVSPLPSLHSLAVMALLLDDGDVFVVTKKAPQQPAQQAATAQPHSCLVLDDKREVGDSMQPRATASSSSAETSTPSTVVATPHREHSRVSPDVPVTVPLRGGDGMQKMEALSFGKSKGVLALDGGAVSLKRSAESAFGAAVLRTPVAQKTASAQVFDYSTDGNYTQPKTVSAARSLSSPLPPKEKPSTTSLETTLIIPEERSSQAVICTSPNHQCNSLSASPPARSPSTPFALTCEQTVFKSTPTSVATQSTKTQTRLSDFFTKMACKR
ncbi:hypothetical protein LPMP_321720 [Leishmania panamensis]|uniref:Uncharacterized protein n=1 Tax=Leishmania panamensis TaxID=5679 RepID=A0A088SGW7_LEIPA|nr:hypothetical protein LPMP_321720 [Leishmania panamensis]AIO01057.1 hypothetical protein LPMP_321720 [Leishmania panamensis]